MSKFIMMAMALVLAAAVPARVATAAVAMPVITQPAQPTAGPGGSDYPHASVRVSQGGKTYNAYYVFEPASPRPASAPVVIMTHGYFEFSGYKQLRDFITHTVRRGNVVIYPRYQTALWTPCLGSINSERCMTSAATGILGGIALLQSDPTRVQPELDKASYFGFSYGGIITANLTNRWAALKLPQPRAIFLDDPHDGGVQGTDEPALDKDLSGIPASTLIQCHVGSQGVVSEKNKALGSCNAFFPRLAHVPESNKNLVMSYPDNHGKPALTATHGVCVYDADAYDHQFCWKTFDAMRSCALQGQDCQYGMGDTPEHRANGVWSDGVPIKPLKIQTGSPIAP